MNRIPVPNGQYSVVLHFAETYGGITGPGQRVFGVNVNGTSLGNLDIYALAGGPDRAIAETTPATVTSGELDIGFAQVVQEPMIDAIEVLPVVPTYATSASISPSVVSSGASAKIAVRMTSSVPTIAAAEVELYDPSGAVAFQQSWNAWTFQPGQAGGVKLVAGTGQVVTGNMVYGNGGPGIWWDIGSSNATAFNNRLHDNLGPQIHFEISDAASIHDNVVWNTLGTNTNIGIYISSSADAEVYNNAVYDPNGAVGIQAIDDNRSDKPSNSGTNINIHDNNIIQNIDGTDGLKWWDYGSGTISNPASKNRGTNNHFWYPAPESGAVRFEWGPSLFGVISAFAQTAGGAGSSYLSDTARDQLLTSLGFPT